LDHADEHGWQKLRYQESGGIVRPIEKALQIIRERDGMKYFRKTAGKLLENIECQIAYHAGMKALSREPDRNMIRRAVG
jgi:hypothetical protein